MSRNGKPIPIKFLPPEEELIAEVSGRTGFNQSEVVRRAVRLLKLETDKRGFSFILEELAPPPPAALLAEPPAAAYGPKKEKSR